VTRYRLGVDLRVRRPLIVAACCVVAFAALLVASHFVGPIARWDGTALQGLRSLSEDHRWIWITNDALVHTVDLPGLVGLLLAICGAGMYLGRRDQALAAAVLVVVAVIVSQVVKVAASHPRYQPILGDNQLSEPAFPSGHATTAMALALAAVLVAPSRWRMTAAVAGGGFALAVSIALMIQGWHFPSDVLGGLLVSSAISMLVLAGLRASEGVRNAGHGPVEQRTSFALRSVGARALEVLAVPAAIAIALLVITHPNELTSYAATHTSGLVAAVGIAAALAGLVYGVTAELENP
jgi:membrane-associated phospholipid phosphatase